MKNILITGGAGFVGSHAAEYFSKKGFHVTVFDNLSRGILLKTRIKSLSYNWNYLNKLSNIRCIKGDVTNKKEIEDAARGQEVIIHTAAQTAVTTSVTNPEPDFQNNAIGTFRTLEAARKNKVSRFVYCSTNKVYGENVNKVDVIENDRRYKFGEPYTLGIPESFDIDLCEHTPYGCSKLSGDLYVQDYAHLYDLKTGVFRMSCIYGTRQFGVEDQGWIAWFTIATLLGKPLVIYGDGKQVRDVLFVSDLVNLFDKFIHSNVNHGVYNIGGGEQNTLSLLELIDMIEEFSAVRSKTTFSDWRPSDQKVYISDIRKAEKELAWTPEIEPEKGVKRIIDWVEKNISLF